MTRQDYVIKSAVFLQLKILTTETWFKRLLAPGKLLPSGKGNVVLLFQNIYSSHSQEYN